MNAEKFLSFLNGQAAGQPSTFEGMSAAAVLFAVFIGGIALNLTPCVLPMIPVNLSIIGAAQKENRKRSVFRAVVYSAGIVLASGITGCLSIFGGASLGGLAATWYFNLAASVIFLLLGISMFDLVTIDLSKFRRTGITSAAGTAGVLLLGVMTALLAGACVAPVVIAVMIYSAGLYAAGASWGLVLPFLLGFGMALPWPILAAGISFLPKPGRWMNHVKHGFGVLILLLAVYYGFQAWRLGSGRQGSAPGTGSTEAVLEEAFERSRRSGKPVLVDFYADWCKNCVAMEHSAFQDPAVRKKLEDFEFVRFDATKNEDPEVLKVLNRFGIRGLPAFLVLRPSVE